MCRCLVLYSQQNNAEGLDRTRDETQCRGKKRFRGYALSPLIRDALLILPSHEQLTVRSSAGHAGMYVQYRR